MVKKRGEMREEMMREKRDPQPAFMEEEPITCTGHNRINEIYLNWKGRSQSSGQNSQHTYDVGKDYSCVGLAQKGVESGDKTRGRMGSLRHGRIRREAASKADKSLRQDSEHDSGEPNLLTV
ncbi:hypothetical protein HAX54_029586 [Datura stramonium]|uniref:Uncharacterized protein n=1 Tax=Datura stramonium TaxID=4076 RepID=A0ABS8V7I2_DATST|nr:hypothetical protein [Datura stramonium]